MSTFEEHEAEQAEITAACEAGECDHSECHEDDAYMSEIVDRSAPRWAWDIIDELLSDVSNDGYLDDDGDFLIQGDCGAPNQIQALRQANKAMMLACERADDQPIPRDEVSQ